MAEPQDANITPAAVRTCVTKMRRHGELASEHAGHKGQTVKAWVDKHGGSARVLGMVERLDRQESTKRLGFYRELLQLGLALGHFDQLDAFDDMRDIARDISESEPAPPPSNSEAAADASALADA